MNVLFSREIKRDLRRPSWLRVKNILKGAEAVRGRLTQLFHKQTKTTSSSVWPHGTVSVMQPMDEASSHADPTVSTLRGGGGIQVQTTFTPAKAKLPCSIAECFALLGIARKTSWTGLCCLFDLQAANRCNDLQHSCAEFVSQWGGGQSGMSPTINNSNDDHNDNDSFCLALQDLFSFLWPENWGASWCKLREMPINSNSKIARSGTLRTKSWISFWIGVLTVETTLSYSTGGCDNQAGIHSCAVGVEGAW